MMLTRDIFASVLTRVIILLTIGAVWGARAEELSAVIHMKGIRGTLSFRQDSPAQKAQVSASLSGKVPGSMELSLHEFPVPPDTPDGCNEKHIGQRILPIFTGSFQKNMMRYYSGVDIVTPTKSIMGRSVKLQKNGIVVCGTLLPRDKKVKTARARFTGATVAGTVVFRQNAIDFLAPVSIVTDLIWLDYKKIDASLSWSILNERECYRSNSGSGVFNPFGINANACKQDDHKKCLMGDLTNKLGKVMVSKTGVKSTYIDANLALTGDNKVVDKILVLKQGSKVLACGEIREFMVREATAYFSDDDVSGFIKFTQPSPYDATSVDIDLSNLRVIAGGYHVHKFPTPPRLDANSRPCSDAVVSGHLNPYNIVKAKGPADGVGTNDEYEIGDLSGKFGGLAKSDNFNKSFVDYNLPLFGRNSIIGRSLVIHYASDNRRWFCSNIRSPRVKTAVATFTDRIVGFIRFEQISGDQQTAIYAELKYADNTPATSNHDWEIHESRAYPPNRDAPTSWDLNSDTKCMETGGHYNPSRASLPDEYKTVCGPDRPLRCELGDLMAKLSAIGIARSNATSPSQEFFTDSYLPLDPVRNSDGSEVSIFGRSIVIHAKEHGTPRLACADIIEEPSVKVMANFGGRDTFVMEQDTQYSLTKIENHIQRKSGSYRYEILKQPNVFCKRYDASDVFDPLNVGLTSSKDETDDKYEIGSLTARVVYRNRMQVKNLPLFPPHSIVGRTMRTAKISGANTRCAALMLQDRQKYGYYYTAQAQISGEYVGSVKMSQYSLPSGGLSPLTILVYLRYASNSERPRKSVNHGWTIQAGLLQHGSCHTSHIYNPANVNMTLPHYEKGCRRSSPWQCALGDLTNVYGTVRVGYGRDIYHTPTLALDNIYSIVGQSFVFYKPSSNEAVACGNIVMMTAMMEPISLSKDIDFTSESDRYGFSAVVAKKLKIEPWLVELRDEPSSMKPPSDRCQVLTAAFAGKMGGLRLKSFMEIFNDPKTTEDLGLYKKCGAGSITSHVSLWLLVPAVLYYLRA